MLRAVSRSVSDRHFQNDRTRYRPMNAPQTIDKQLIAHDFRVAMHGKLEPEKIDEAAQALAASQKAYPANGSVASMIFYLKFQVNITDGKTFDGHAGGA